MRMAFCLLLALLACSKKQEPEYGTVCGVENYYLAEDANGRILDPKDALKGTKLIGFTPENPLWLTFQRGGMGSVDWQIWDVVVPRELDYEPGSPLARLRSVRDGGVLSTHPIHVEGSPPKSVVFGYMTQICSPDSQPGYCADPTEDKLVYVTFTCNEERL